ncbi:hypothetical protein HS7_17050 [Sulfolobales archaeon HS-7]|nr:hypothetical protein HS7_17050 [Sulfolobales archaeon HS-7]
MSSEYLGKKPSTKVKLIDVVVPCGVECLTTTEFREILNNERVKEQLEIIDSMIFLIEQNVKTLSDRVGELFSEYNLNIDNLVYSIYWKLEKGGDFNVSDALYFNDRKIMDGDFKSLMTVLNEIQKAIDNDKDLRDICDQINYLSESLWNLFENNIRRLLE